MTVVPLTVTFFSVISPLPTFSPIIRLPLMTVLRRVISGAFRYTEPLTVTVPVSGPYVPALSYTTDWLLARSFSARSRTTTASARVAVCCGLNLPPDPCMRPASATAVMESLLQAWLATRSVKPVFEAEAFSFSRDATMTASSSRVMDLFGLKVWSLYPFM
ncbi:hypothetical protein D3C73_1307810 [compost metagenome]